MEKEEKYKKQKALAEIESYTKIAYDALKRAQAIANEANVEFTFSPPGDNWVARFGN